MKMIVLFLSISMACCAQLVKDWDSRPNLGKPEVSYLDARIVPYVYGCTQGKDKNNKPYRKVTVFIQIVHPNVVHDDTYVSTKINDEHVTIFPKANTTYSWSLTFPAGVGKHEIGVWWLRGPKGEEAILGFQKVYTNITECHGR